jgi:hypothetical protein
MPDITKLMLEALPPGSRIKSTLKDGSKPFMAVRIDADYGGAATEGWGLFGTKQWLEIADWEDVELTVVHNAAETDMPPFPSWSSLVESLTKASWPDGKRDGFPTRRTAELIATQVFKDHGLEDELTE